MNLTTLKGDIQFWDVFAPWYEKWITRGQYHQALIREISQMIEPGWKVLDIGAATGVLSFPMVSIGCKVEALEPSKGMQQIFRNKITDLGITQIDIVDSNWEDFHSTKSYDLILACNSLHLTKGGIKEGMKKVFSFNTQYVCLITEINQTIFIDFKEIDSVQEDYSFLYIRNYKLDSSFVFDNMDEVKELAELLNRDIQVDLRNERYIQYDSTDVAVLWWERI